MITLDNVKRYCRVIGDDFNAELELYTGAAVKHIEQLTKRKVYLTSADKNSDASTAEDIKEKSIVVEDELPVELAIYKLVADWFLYKTDTTDVQKYEMPNAVWSLIQPYHYYPVGP